MAPNHLDISSLWPGISVNPYISFKSRESFYGLQCPVFLPNRFDFMKSKLLFESLSDGSKSVNLVSHSLLAYDTRYSECNKAAEGKHNVFDCILQPSRTGNNRASLQLELHYRYWCAILNHTVGQQYMITVYVASVLWIIPCYYCF